MGMGTAGTSGGAVEGEKAALMAAIGPDLAAIEQAMHDDLAMFAGETDALLAEVLRYGLFNGGKWLPLPSPLNIFIVPPCSMMM